jgi:hypothetical protein
MLIPITRQTFEEVVPLIATGDQYRYYWGDFSDFLKRLLLSVIAVVVVLLVGLFFGEAFAPLRLLLGIIAGLYWFWGPVYWASLRNRAVRRYPYCGFWRGRVRDAYVTEELIGTEETVNKRGELVIVENRERRLNVEVRDKTGFTTALQVPLRRQHKGIAPRQVAEMLVFSYQPNLETIVQTSDLYIPSLNLWVSDYPYLQRDVFAQVSRQLSSRGETSPRSAERVANSRRRRR